MSDVVHYKEEQLDIAPANNKKGKTLTDKQKAFLSALSLPEVKGNIREAMRLAGYSDNTRPDEVLANLSEEIIEIANKALAVNTVKAAMGLVNVIENPANPGNKDVIAAAKEILDRAGVFKDKGGDKGNIIHADNVFILPPKESVDKPKAIE